MTALDWFLIFHFLTLPFMWVLFYFLYNTLEGKQPYWSYPIWIVGVVFDLYVNIFWGTLILLQLPNINRLFFSARLDYNIKESTGWRKEMSIDIVGYLLEPYDKSIPKQHSTYGLFK